jgi:hypothetical protein
MEAGQNLAVNWRPRVQHALIGRTPTKEWRRERDSNYRRQLSRRNLLILQVAELLESPETPI